MDQSKKTMRHFYCRDVLWETFEQMANDFDCSIDYLINESMRFYARSKNYQAGAASSSQIPQQANGGQAQPRMTRPPPAPVPSQGSMSAPMQRQPIPSMPPQPPPRTSRPTPAPPNPRITPDPVSAVGPTLFLVFNNQRIPIDKDQFIIGR